MISSRPVITFLADILQFTSIIGVVILLFWRFLIPPNISHLSSGDKVFNIERKARLEVSFLGIGIGVILILFIEIPELIGPIVEEGQRIYVYLLSVIFIIIGAYLLHDGLKKEKLIPLTEIDIKRSKVTFVVLKNMGLIVVVLIMCFILGGINYSNTEAMKPVLVKDILSDSLAKITLYEKPNNSSASTLVVFKKEELRTVYGTCYFYELSLIDTAGIAYKGFVAKGARELIDADISIIKDATYINKCKNKTNREEVKEKDPIEWIMG